MNENTIDIPTDIPEERYSPRSLPRLLLDWVLYCFFILGFILVLVIFDPAQRIAIRFGHKWHDRVIYLISHGLYYCLKILGTKVEFIGQAPKTTNPLIVVSNHQSMWDISLSYVALRQFKPRYIAKKELGKWLPSVSYNLRHGLNAIIDRKDPRQSIKALQDFAKTITANNLCAVIFPEGTRSRTGVLKDFHSAGLNTLLKYAPSADILPLCIDGSWRFNKQNKLPPYTFTTVKVYIGNLINRGQIEDKTVADTAFNFVKSKLITKDN